MISKSDSIEDLAQRYIRLAARLSDARPSNLARHVEPFWLFSVLERIAEIDGRECWDSVEHATIRRQAVRSRFNA